MYRSGRERFSTSPVSRADLSPRRGVRRARHADRAARGRWQHRRRRLERHMPRRQPPVHGEQRLLQRPLRGGHVCEAVPRRRRRLRGRRRVLQLELPRRPVCARRLRRRRGSLRKRCRMLLGGLRSDGDVPRLLPRRGRDVLDGVAVLLPPVRGQPLHRRVRARGTAVQRGDRMLHGQLPRRLLPAAVLAERIRLRLSRGVLLG